MQKVPHLSSRWKENIRQPSSPANADVVFPIVISIWANS